jgi:hypothetical protein
VYHTTGFSKDEIAELCALIHPDFGQISAHGRGQMICASASRRSVGKGGLGGEGVLAGADADGAVAVASPQPRAVHGYVFGYADRDRMRLR